MRPLQATTGYAILPCFYGLVALTFLLLFGSGPAWLACAGVVVGLVGMAIVSPLFVGPRYPAFALLISLSGLAWGGWSLWYLLAHRSAIAWSW